MAKTVLLRVPHGPHPNPKSSWFSAIHQMRVVLDPYEMIVPERGMDPTAVGIFFRMLPYVAQKERIEENVTVLARLAGVSLSRMKTWWPGIKWACFEEVEGGVRLRNDLPWLTVQQISASRQTLTHLLDRLAEYWGNACVYCGTKDGDLQVEHIVPLARGGTDDLQNLTLACPPCNRKKRTQTAAEFGFPDIHERAKWIH